LTISLRAEYGGACYIAPATTPGHTLIRKAEGAWWPALEHFAITLSSRYWQGFSGPGAPYLLVGRKENMDARDEHGHTAAARGSII
jgi:hypothetical protein